MNCTTTFWLVFAVLLFIFAYCDRKYGMLRDMSIANPKPYSWSRVQLAWWTLIILSSFITILICTPGHQAPTLDTSTLILLGITTGTTAAARLIDVSDQKNPAIANAIMAQNQPKENFILDILSDGHGVTIPRLQAVIFNFVFGVWFINYVLHNFADPCAALHLTATSVNPAIADCAAQPWSYIIPAISQNNLILLGLSSATYAVLKTTENSQSAATIGNGNGGAIGGDSPQPNNNQQVPQQPNNNAANPDQPITG